MLRKLLFLFVLTLISCQVSNAAPLKGYRITQENDTIWGEVKKYYFNQVQNTVVFNGIDLERYHVEVFFRPLNQSQFKRCTTRDTREFGFTYKNQEYVYRRFELHKKSISKRGRLRPRFLQLVYEGELQLYKNRIRLYDMETAQNINSKRISSVHPELYLYNESQGLQSVAKTSEISDIYSLLSPFDVPSAFLQSVPANYPFKDIRNLLVEYDRWLKERYSVL